MRRRSAVALIAAPLLLAACGTAPETPPTTEVTAVVQADGSHNETDVMFLQ
jgi:uncharacterized lipoprotein YajG